jgi:sodium pump decarboxylase gamma subunit
MTTTELMLQFSNPETLKTLSTGGKLLAGLITTVLGIGITFCALTALMLIVTLMARVAGTERPAPPETAAAPSRATPATGNEDEELAAVITAVLAHHLHIASEDIIIKNIARIEDSTPVWSRMGILEQINSRL